MSDDNRRAADELDRLLSELQHGQRPEPSQELDDAEAGFASQLVQLTRTTHLDPPVAAQIAARVQQGRQSERQEPFAYWRRWVAAWRTPARQPAFVALVTLAIAVSSFVVFNSLSAPEQAMPARPRAFVDFGQAILGVLNSQPNDAASVRALLSEWGALKAPAANIWDATGDLWSVDVDGNGEADLLLALLDPDKPESDGAFLLYLKQQGKYRLAQETRGLSSPRILFAQDLLGGGRSVVGRSVATCSQHTCSVAVDVLRWDNQQWHSLLVSPAQMVEPEIELKDSPQGTKELVLHGGVVNAAGAGPQRARTEVYRWNGAAFALAETRTDAATYLYIKVADANALMQQRQFADALTLYQEAATNNRLRTWEAHDAAQERADLQSFARFRMMVGYTLLGDDAKAQIWRDYTLNQQPNHVYARVTSLYWQNYASSKSVADGCRAVTAYAEANPAVAAVLNDFGFANPIFRARDVCPFN